MAPFITSSDVESVTIQWLTGRIPGVRIVTEIPGDLATEIPLVQVERIGGIPTSLVIDPARLDFFAFAGNRADARTLAYRVRDELEQRFPQTTVKGGFISRVKSDGGPTWLPYDNTNVRRYHVAVDITVHSQ